MIASNFVLCLEDRRAYLVVQSRDEVSPRPTVVDRDLRNFTEPCLATIGIQKKSLGISFSCRWFEKKFGSSSPAMDQGGKFRRWSGGNRQVRTPGARSIAGFYRPRLGARRFKAACWGCFARIHRGRGLSRLALLGCCDNARVKYLPILPDGLSLTLARPLSGLQIARCHGEGAAAARLRLTP